MYAQFASSLAGCTLVLPRGRSTKRPVHRTGPNSTWKSVLVYWQLKLAARFTSPEV